jgi:glutamate-1-semialdehyde 2,1-aminomutase
MRNVSAARSTRTDTSQRLFAEASKVIPGGVNSPVRAFGGVGGTPRFVASGQGATLHDVDGNMYLDLVMSWGPLLHGHAHPRIVEAVVTAARQGTSFGAPIELEVRLAQTISAMVPSIEMVRFVSSGTEATMSALRLARAYTGRDLILKFEGCYHGHADMLLVQAGSGALTHGVPTSPGVPASTVATTLTCPYNDLHAVQDIVAKYGADLAAIIVEPVAGNMGVVPPAPGFLTGLRDLATRTGAVLIFDEIITGFRVAPGGAQQLYGVRPDLTCLGKIIGGGLPVAAYGGRADIMSLVSPLGPVYQAGTLSGNPLAMAAGLASLSLAAESDYGYLEMLAQRLQTGLIEAADKAGVELTVNRVASMLSAFFTRGPVTNLVSAQGSDTKRYAAFFQAMLERGVYLPPSQYETWMLSFAHTPPDIDRVVEVARAALRS